MRREHTNQFMTGAWILSLGALLSKILSAVYRVPFQNIVGDTGFYIYQQVYPIYGLGMVLALSGLPVYISKLIAAADGPDGKRRVARRSIAVLGIIGGGAFLVTYFGAPLIARAMADTQLTPLIQCTAWMFLLLPIVGGGRAYFQGLGNMVPTAASQVAEQLVRVGVIISAAVVGHALGWSLYRIGTIAMGGALAGGVVAALMLAPRLRRALSGQMLPRAKGLAGVTFTRRFLRDGSAFVLFSALMILLQMVDSFTMTRGLMSGGMSASAARVAKGIYDRGQPFVQLGLVVATALAQSLLPSLTRHHHTGRTAAFRRTGIMMLHLSMLAGFLASAGLVGLMPAANHLLFGDRQGSHALAVFALSIGIVATLNAMTSLLQSQNHFRTPSVALVVAVVAKAVLNPLLIPAWGSLGSAIATDIALLAALGVIYAALPGTIQSDLWRDGFGPKLIVFTLSVAVSGRLVTALLPFGGRGGAFIICLLSGSVALAVGVLVATGLRLLTVREVLALPAGRRLLRVLGRRREH